MKRIKICKACQNEASGAKTRIEIPHTCQKSLDSIPVSVYDELFKHMSEEHGIRLLVGQMQDIVNICAIIIVQQDYIENELPEIKAGLANL